MTLPLVETPRANLDVAEIVDYLRTASLDAAVRFYDAYDAALQSIARAPQAGARLTLPGCEHLDLRFVKPRRFKKYLVIYRVTPSAVEVVRVLHGSRDIVAALK